MVNTPANLVFEGGGVLGISYLGALQYLYQSGILQSVKRVAGTSAGAITACITSFHLPFEKTRELVDTLDYKKIPQESRYPELKAISEPALRQFEEIFGDLGCLYRLMTKYGWYSSEYFYNWLKKQIASQFDHTKKLPPYTFADFKNPSIHKEQRPFHDLYVVGTNLSYRSSNIFCYENTPHMEVAQAVRVSMSIPLFFEAVEYTPDMADASANIFCDGGVMWNYPINMFDSAFFTKDKRDGVNEQTLGLRFLSSTKYHEINNFLDFINNLYHSQLRVQQNYFENSPQDIARSIQINPGDVSFVDFDITTGDETYLFLYYQGYQAARNYFNRTNDRSIDR